MAAAAEAAPEPVVYAVPGSPLVAERTVELLRADDRVEVTLLPALSFLDLAWAALGIDPLAEGVRLVDAGAFGPVAAAEHGPVPGGAVLVAPPALRGQARRAGRRRPAAAPPGAPAPPRARRRGGGARSTGGSSTGRVEPDHLTSLYVPALPRPAERSAGAEVARLAALMDTLRERCPWDRAQTHASLMPHLVEECYEVLDALAAPGRAATPRTGAAAHLRGGAGRPAVPDRLPCPPGRRGGPVRPGRRGPGRARQAGAPPPPRVRRRRRRQRRTRWCRTGRRSRRREKGRSSVTEGIPAALPALMLTTKLARKAPLGGPRARRHRRASRRPPRWRRSTRLRAGRASLVPTTRSPARRGDVSRAGGRAALRGGEPGAAPRRRRGAGAARPRPGAARGHPRGRRRPRPGRWATANLVPRCPTRADTQGVMS